MPRTFIKQPKSALVFIGFFVTMTLYFSLQEKNKNKAIHTFGKLDENYRLIPITFILIQTY